MQTDASLADVHMKVNFVKKKKNTIFFIISVCAW